jgi:hypothetical protein
MAVMLPLCYVKTEILKKIGIIILHPAYLYIGIANSTRDVILYGQKNSWICDNSTLAHIGWCIGGFDLCTAVDVVRTYWHRTCRNRNILNHKKSVLKKRGRENCGYTVLKRHGC